VGDLLLLTLLSLGKGKNLSQRRCQLLWLLWRLGLAQEAGGSEKSGDIELWELLLLRLVVVVILSVMVLQYSSTKNV
jgi:hypothetical protein